MQEGGVNWLVANQCTSDFRACVLSLTFTSGEALVLDQATADLLCVAAGDTLRLTREA
jgi:arginine/ornithine N-succinyltransferase beta subunit